MIDVPDNRTGGASRYVHFVSEELRRTGHRIDLVFTTELGQRPLGRLRRFAAPVSALLMVLARLRRGIHYETVEMHEPLAAAYATARRVMRSLPPLLVSVYALESRAVEARLSYARMRGQRVSWWSRVAPLTVVWQANFALRMADHVLVETSEDAEYLQQRLGVPAHRITLQHGGVVPVFFEPASGPRAGVLFVGSWIERKGIRDFVPAVTALLEERPGTRVTLAGYGCPTERVQADFPAHVRPHLRLVPRITDDTELAALYREHAVFAFPSTFEGQPLVLLEAAAAGLAIVTTRTCGMRDFVTDGATGLLVEVGDTAGFTRALSLLVGSLELSSRLGEAAREAARPYTWSRSAEQFLAGAAAAAGAGRGRVLCRA
jgi:glycosyltransferase involved in cell wall biosynthesis